jgi:hypothetical protein
MATKLTQWVTRETTKRIGKRPVLVTLAPAGSQDEALIGLRLKGKRTQYVCALSDVYRLAALWHGQKEANAKRAARKAGIPWKRAKHDFERANAIPPVPRKPREADTAAMS